MELDFMKLAVLIPFCVITVMGCSRSIFPLKTPIADEAEFYFFDKRPIKKNYENKSLSVLFPFVPYQIKSKHYFRDTYGYINVNISKDFFSAVEVTRIFKNLRLIKRTQKNTIPKLKGPSLKILFYLKRFDKVTVWTTYGFGLPGVLLHFILPSGYEITNIDLDVKCIRKGRCVCKVSGSFRNVRSRRDLFFFLKEPPPGSVYIFGEEDMKRQAIVNCAVRGVMEKILGPLKKECGR